jgi:hypothetical protein
MATHRDAAFARLTTAFADTRIIAGPSGSAAL